MFLPYNIGMKQIKNCKKCGSLELIYNRRLCKKCNALRVKNYYILAGKAKKQNKKANCIICNHLFVKHRKQQVNCPSCYKQSIKTDYKLNPYKKIGCRDEHRILAEKLLSRKLSYNEIVHHVDEDPQNNKLENLWVMSRHNHGKLHLFLRIQKVAYEKSLGQHSVNCWNILRVNQTTAWLETTGAKVIKLIELDNQQPSICKDEGSETRDGISD